MKWLLAISLTIALLAATVICFAGVVTSGEWKTHQIALTSEDQIFDPAFIDLVCKEVRTTMTGGKVGTAVVWYWRLDTTGRKLSIEQPGE